MAVGPITLRAIDSNDNSLASWQTLKGPVTTAETALTAGQLLQNWRDVTADEDTVEIIAVEGFDSIVVMPLARGSDNQSPVLNFYGWPETGPGNHIGTVTIDLSTAVTLTPDDPNYITPFFASGTSHESVRKAFASSAAWRVPDQYVITADYEQERFIDTAATPIHIQYHRALAVRGTSAIGGTIGTPTAEANFPQQLIVDFCRSRYRYFGVLITALDSATAVGAIFRAVKFR